MGLKRGRPKKKAEENAAEKHQEMGLKRGRPKKKVEENTAETHEDSGLESSCAADHDDPSYTPRGGRPTRRREESDDQGDSGAGDGGCPSPAPSQGILPALDGSANITSMSRRYNTRPRLARQDNSPSTASISRLLLAQRKTFASPSRLPIRNVNGVASPCVTPPGRTSDKLVTELPPQAQSQAGGYETARNSSPEHPSQTISSMLRSHEMPVLDNVDFASNERTARPSSVQLGTENRLEVNGINCHGNDTGHLSRASSFNYTRVAQMLEDDNFDEVGSAADPALVPVNGYRVKVEFAPLLRSILSKFGDIAKNSCLKSVASRSAELERLCAIFQNLQRRKFTGITRMEIDSMLVDVEDLESVVGLELGWLRQRLQEISESLIEVKEYQSMKSKKEKLKEDLEIAKENIRLAEKEHAAILAEGEKVAGKLEVTKVRMRMFQKSLVDGLL